MRQERKNHDIAFAYYQAIGKIPKDMKKREWCLHHVDTTLRYTDRARYDEWRIEDVVPMTTSEHMAWHVAHRSEETKRKISETLMGHEVSEETRRKISEACKGKPSWLKGTHGLITSPMKGKHHTEEARRKCGDANRGRVQSDEEKSKRVESLKKFYAEHPRAGASISKATRGSFWITDGKSNRRVFSDADIPEGWRRGRASWI